MGICLPVQGAQVLSLVWEDSVCCRAIGPGHHNYRNLCALEPMLHNKRSQHNERPVPHNEEQSPLVTAREILCTATETQYSQK